MTRGRLTRIGAVAALVIASAAVLTTLTREETYEVTAVFEQAHGLVAGGRVVAGGVDVGEIAAVEIGPDGLPHVRMRIRTDYRLRRGAVADLRLLSNSGELNREITLTRGRGPKLGDGAVIPSAQTAEPVELDQILNTLDPGVRADMRYVIGRIDGSTRGLAPALTRTLDRSATALEETAALAREVDQDGVALRTLVTQGQVASSALARDREALGSTVDRLAGLLTTGARHGPELREAVHALEDGLRSPRLALDELRTTVPVLDELVAAAAPAARELRPTATLARRTLRAARPALGELEATLRTAPGELRKVRPLLRIAGSTLARLTPVLEGALPVLDYARVATPETAGLISNWASMESAYDAAGHGARMFPTYSQRIPNTTVSASSIAPGYVPPPFLRTPGALAGQPWDEYERSFLSEAAP